MFNYTDCKLRLLEEKDLELLLEWRNKEHIRQSMFNNRIILRDEHYNWFQKICDNPRNRYFIFELNTNPMGIVNFTDIDYLNKRSDWGFYIGNSKSPRGCGTAMGYLALDYIFSEVNLHKICGQVLQTNENSVKFHTRLGFKSEGILKEQIYRDGKFLDVYLFGCMQNDWASNRDKLFYAIFNTGYTGERNV